MRGKLRPELGLFDGGIDASMRPAHCAREVRRILQGRRQAGAASMRPAHCAREVASWCRPWRSAQPCFNEARALCAGS